MTIRKLEALFRNNIRPSQLEIEAIEREVASQTAAIEKEQLQIQKLEFETQKYQALLAPLRRLNVPIEILSEIFSVVISDTPRKSIPSQVIDICLVCKYWRQAALLTPRLWNDLSVSFECRQNTVNAAQRWVDRAGGVPKNLRFNGFDAVHDFCATKACPLNNRGLAKLLVLTPNIHHVTLKCQAMSCLQNLIAELMVPLGNALGRPSSWDTLRSLKLKAEFWDDEEPTDKEDRFLALIPPVTSLSLTLPTHLERLDENGIPPDLEISSLTNLVLNCDWDIQWILGSLHHCINLETLTFDFVNAGEFADDAFLLGGIGATVVPKVRTLRMRRVQQEGYETNVLKALSMPALEELDVSFLNLVERGMERGGHDLVEFTADIDEFLETSGVEDLRRLRLHHLSLSSNGFFNIASSFPSLVHLTFDRVLFDSSVLKRPSDTAELPFQDLEILELLNVPMLYGMFDAHDVYSFLEKKHAAAVEDGMECPKEKLVMSLQSQEDIDPNVETSRIPAWFRPNLIDYEISIVDRIP